MKKYKLLVIPSDRTGVGKFRSVDPHTYISEHYSDIFDVEIRYPNEIPTENQADFLRQFDIVHIHKQLDPNLNIVNMMKFLAVKVIVDVDDYWDLGQYHPMALTARREKWAEPIKAHLAAADACTTTTPIFAREISKLNNKVYVLPNAINPDEEQFKVNKEKSDRIRFGVVCGSSHLHDLMLLNGVASKLSKETLSKMQFVLCGFDTNGTRTIYHEDTGEVERRPIRPEESVWCDYERILTDDYKIVTPEHKQFLLQYMKGVDRPDKSDCYMRYWTRHITQYATHYNNVDVLLAPLKECPFNQMKSQLKVIEAGFMDCAIIAQDFGAYQLDIKNVFTKGGEIDPNGNGILVDSSKNHKLWARYIEKLANEPELVDMLKKNLHDSIVDKYSISAVTKDRVNVYLEVLGDERAGKV